MTVQILQGNVLDTLKDIPAGSVRCTVTSPPYYGLRSYLPFNHPLKSFEIGTEATPELYIENLVRVFDEVWRVLSDDGTLWLNLGDSYVANATGSQGNGTSKLEGGKATQIEAGKRPNKVGFDLKPKDLMMIPARVAIALQQSGWYLRSEIVWHKPNPMPESVKDRPTRSHEMIYLLSKNERYYYDYEAILEPAEYDGRNDTKFKGSEKYKDSGQTFAERGHERWTNTIKKQDETGNRTYTGFNERYNESHPDGIPARNKRDVWTVTTKPYSGAHFATFPPDLIEPCILAGSAVGDTVLDPFGGSGTTAAVATKHNRNAIVCELNPEYLPLINKRMSEVQPYMIGMTT